MADKTAPKSRLRLEWIYGYRGFQCRNNLYYISDDEIVYFIAGVGVVYNTQHQAQRFFLGHNDDIVSLSLHPKNQLVATGQVGKDAYICVWNAITMETVSILKDQHEHAVGSIAFSPSGEKIASVGLDQDKTLIVWDWKSGRMLAKTKGHSDRLFDIAWEPLSEDKFVTCGVKVIKFWTLCGNSLTASRGIFGKTGDLQTLLSVQCAEEQVTYSGALNGDIYVWRAHNLERVIPAAHSAGIVTLYQSADGYATGGRDGMIKLWDFNFNEMTSVNLQNGPYGYKNLAIRSVCWAGDRLLVGTQHGEIFEVSVQNRNDPVPLMQGHSEGELWALSMHPSKPIAATASDDHTVRLWSLVDHALLTRCNLDHPARSCAFNADGTQLAVGCKNGSFYVLRTRDMSEIVRVHDRKEVLHEMKFSPDGSYLAVASNDNFVDIYVASQKFKRVGTCSKASSFITHIDWSQDGRHLQADDGAGEKLVYSMPSGKHVTSAEEIRVIQWKSWTCVLGSEVNGMWPKYSQINDVNAVDASIPYDTLATGDDFGLVKLFRFPCLKKGAQFRKYVGHSAHVTNVRFSCDNHWLLTTGGADHALFQWTFLSDDKALSQVKDLPDQDTATDSCSERSDSDLSDVGEVDSEIEQEAQISYDREVYKEDIAKLKQVAKQESKNHVKKSKKQNSLSGNISLRLSFVHGYRGFDCRDNIFYTNQDEIVYHVAALAIIYSRKHHTQRFYDKHDDDILCLTLHPVKQLVATGQVGKDPAIHVWGVQDLSTVSILKGFHERGVSSVCFSGDGKKLASIGLDNDHSLAIWDWRRGEKLASSKTYQDKVFVVRFHLDDPEKLVTAGVKHIKFWQHVGGGCTSHRGVFGNVGKLDTMLCVVCWKQGVSYSGAANGQIYVWKDNKLTRTLKAHDGPCFAMCALEKGFVTGGKDGVVCIWDESFEVCVRSYPIISSNLSSRSRGILTESNPTVRAICLGNTKILVGTKKGEILEIDKEGPINILVQGHAEGEVWGLAFHPSKKECCTVSNDLSLRSWCTTPGKNQMLRHRKLTVGGQCCSYSPDGNAIAVGCNDGSFLVVNTTTLENLVNFHHRKEAISDIKFSPGAGKYLAVGSHDNYVDIYNVLNSKRVGVCKGASSYITHLDWDARGKLLCVNSGAKELLYFEAPRGKRQTISSDEAIEWSSWTGVLGKSCEGIWPAYSDVTDVNATCLDQGKKYLITGDDFGFVKLFNFPVKEKHSKFKKYVGHSAHVTNVRWSHDSSQAGSIGGADTALLLWAREEIEISGRSLSKSGGSLTDFSYQGASEDSDTDSEEEGYDSDVARENNIDYSAKTYAANIRDTAGVKPNMKEVENAKKTSVTRKIPKSDRVARSSHVAVNRVTDLKLDHIFGYRGFDCRDNLHYLEDASRIVYHAAGAGIVQDLSSNKQSFYLEHTDDIISLAVNQSPKYRNVIATGQLGVSPTIHVWDAITKKSLSILREFHSGGVCALNFSVSGKLLLSVGLDDQHSVAIWRWQEGALACSHTCGRKRIFNAQFRPDSNTSFVTVGVKHVMFWQVCGSAILGKRGVLGASSQIQAQTMLSIAFGANGITFTGAMTGDVYVWKDNILNRTVTKAHAGPVFSMFTTLQDGLIVSGGKESKNRDAGGAVKLWDQEMKRCRAFDIASHVVKSVSREKGKILVGTKESEVVEIAEKTGASLPIVYGHTEGELWGLSCHPKTKTCFTSSLDRTGRLWDLTEKTMTSKIPLSAGSRACSFTHDGNKIAIGQENGEILVLDIVSMKLLAKKRDRGAAIFDIRFSPNDQILAVASEQTLDFYELTLDNTLNRVGYCKQIPNFVFQLDFSIDGKHIQAGTSAYKHLVFCVPSGEQVTDAKTIKSISWDSWTSVLGDDVIGIWPKSSDNADVNCANVSHGGNAVATGDDFGFVKLFDFPCSEKYAKSRRFVGHSAHVTNVRFVADDSRLVSTGGDDCCVFIWSCS